jgi:hypothetical protein
MLEKRDIFVEFPIIVTAVVEFLVMGLGPKAGAARANST